ncbi:hypothetical protein QC762_302690 [Podospora pseudocomata]|uniref:Major facilitator superfamily (MFS) profile domain-containing protein n=2 Tax=Podospora TaxID=5144 RepID=A0ABR0GIJ5_9PEZI|nr:hypothetical protein QC762_302690 [Podospora pseudocomata]KAK4677875.1 hypothetical protein QC764_302690 [Podospora pseudoanserina]
MESTLTTKTEGGQQYHSQDETCVGDISWTPEEERKVVRKVDLRLIPTVWLMFVISWMDRSNLGNAKIAGLNADLHLSSTDYSLAIITFYSRPGPVGYAFCGPLSNLIITRVRPSIYFAGLMMVWGIATCCMGAVKTFPQLLVLRIIVGIFEGGLTPGVYFVISSWYVPAEQAKRAAFVLSAVLLGGAFGGIIAGAVTGGLEGRYGIRGWRWLFIVEGIITIIWAMIAGFILPDFPATCRHFTPEEKRIATSRLRNCGTNIGDNQSDGPRLGKVQSIKLALSDWRTWGVAGGIGLCGCATVLPYFYPTLVNGLGYKEHVTAQYMTVPIWAVAFVCALSSGFIADRIPNHRAAFIAGWSGFAAIISIVVCVVEEYKARYILLIFQGCGVWTCISLGVAVATTTFQDMRPEVRAISVSLPQAVGNAANIYGAYLFPQEHAPRYLAGFVVITVTLAAGSLLFALVDLGLSRRRKVLA